MKEIKAKAYDLDQKKWIKAKEISPGYISLGIKGHRLSALTLETANLRWYRAYNKGSDRWSRITRKYGMQEKEYAGNKKRAMTGIAIKDRRIGYRVHLMNADLWLPAVSGRYYDLSDFNYGYAGDKKHTIDKIEIWRLDEMSYNEPFNPVGTYDPCWMTNGGPSTGGTVTNTTYNTCITGYPTSSGANALWNCVGYAQGRMLSIYMQEHPTYDPGALGTHLFATLNADPSTWIARAQSAGFTVQTSPRAGSVAVMNYHVAVVEKYDADTDTWWLSESGYQNAPGTGFEYYYHPVLYNDGTNWRDPWASNAQADQIVHGFILIPDITPGPGPGPTPGPHRMGYDRRRRYRNV